MDFSKHPASSQARELAIVLATAFALVHCGPMEPGADPSAIEDWSHVCGDGGDGGDASTADARTTDAGGADAMSTDARSDASSGDAGVRDAASSDAGTDASGPVPGAEPPVTPHTNVACTLRAAGGSCDIILESSGTYVRQNGVTNGVRAGNRVCLRAGTYPNLLLENWVGASGHPIEFVNCGGRVVVGAAGSGTGIGFQGSRYVRLTGTGSTSNTYGIFVAGTRDGTQGVAFAGLSSDVEAEFVEVAHAGFAGFMAKTDPSCANDDAVRGHFTMYNVLLHDNYVHDVGGEGFYVGNSFYAAGQQLTCNGVTVRKLPHELVGTRIYRNRVENSGAEGIQVGCGVRDTEVFRNTVRHPGSDPFAAYQNNGIQIGGGTSGRFYSNDVIDAQGNGFIIIGLGDTWVYNNVIVRAANGMYVHHDASVGRTLVIAHNTIVSSRGGTDPARGIWVFNDSATIRAENNIIVNATSAQAFYLQNPAAHWTSLANFVTTDLTAPRFVDTSRDDYHLRVDSVAGGHGVNAASDGIVFDHDYLPRNTTTGFDQGAFQIP